MQQQPQGDNERALDMNDMNLREHLLAAQASQVGGPRSPPSHTSLSPSPLNAHQQPVDPSMGESAYTAMDVEEDEELDADGKKKVSGRELSNSKRAAQNRAAQRAFRQRKESYIKKLEEQVRTYTVMEASYKHLQVENYELRAYILQLQSRLLESQGSYPQPPPTFSMDPHRPHSHTVPQAPSLSGPHHESVSQHQQIVPPAASMTSVPRQSNPYAQTQHQHVQRPQQHPHPYQQQSPQQRQRSPPLPSQILPPIQQLHAPLQQQNSSSQPQKSQQHVPPPPLYVQYEPSAQAREPQGTQPTARQKSPAVAGQSSDYVGGQSMKLETSESTSPSKGATDTSATSSTGQER